MPARPALLVASAFLLCASRAAEVDSAPGAKFNKAELEAILKKEHSDRVSNIYDSENGIQRRRLPNKCPGTQQPRAAARLSRRPARIAQGCRAEPGRRAFAARARTLLLARPRRTERRAAVVGRYTWDVENQELCAGVDGKCSKEEL